MNINEITSERERLIKDKSELDKNIVALEKELDRLKSQSDMLTGAIQTTEFFLGKLHSEDELEVDEEREEVSGSS